ncbi:DUF4012 domain-containing protein [Jatrophihabitans sp. YIM 134969]
MTEPPRPTGPLEPERPDPPDEPGRSDPAKSGFDGAFEGEAWDTRPRRRRSSSSSSSSSKSSAASGRSSRRRSSSSESASRPSTRSSGSPKAKRRGSRRARHVRAVLRHVVLGVLGLGLAWIVVTGVLAAYQLQQARSDLSALRSQITAGGTDIGARADSLAEHAHHAAVLTRGPAWATLAAIPYVGDPADAVRGITTQTSTLVDDAVPGLIAAADDVNPRTVYQKGAVDLTALQRASGPVHRAALAADAANQSVAALPRSTWLPAVDTATDRLAGQLSSLGSTLRTTDQALRVLPTMLGDDGRTRKYFIAFQNNAELRGTGGLPGAFAIATATNGKVAIESFNSDSLLAGKIPSGVDFGKAYNLQYANPTVARTTDTPYNTYVDSNVSPNFPYAAQIWLAMWKNTHGEQLDGALTVDPSALSYLLAATGPTTAPDGVQVTSKNVVALLQKDVYAQFPARGENSARKQYILDVASAVEKKVLSGARNGRALLDGLARGVSERRIVAWSTDPGVQSVLASAPIGGTISATDQPYGMLVLNNGAAGKLDYYLGRSVDVTRSGCGDTRDVTVTIKLTNNAPTSGLPPYVTDRIGAINQPTDLVVGQNRTVVNWVATKGALLTGATLDGRTSGAGLFDEEGHPSFQMILEIKPGQTRTWVLTLQEPAGDQPMTVVRQPGVLPLQVDVDARVCAG